jgi:methionine-rich copper-binding protein CopC
VKRYRLLAAVTATLVAALAVLVPAAPAAAHTELKSSMPAANSTTTEPVTEVKLTFTGVVRRPGTTVVVTGADQISYSVGAAEVLDRTITQKVGALPVGAITVVWRTVALDGHPVQGTFTFTNRAAPPTPSTGSSPTAGPPAAATPQPSTSISPVQLSRASDEASWSVLWWVTGGAVALVLALLGGLLWRRRSTRT